MGDLTLGSKLRAAREIKGVDVSTAAEKTKILPQMLHELEADDFHRIAAPIYAKGFIRTYCGYLNIDPQPLIDEYMQNHNAPIKPGKNGKTLTDPSLSLKPKGQVPALSEMLKKFSFKSLKNNPALLLKTSIGIILILILIGLVSLRGTRNDKEKNPAVLEKPLTEQLIGEPQDVYLIKPGVVEAK